jgi:hypothetical protein
LTRIGVIPQQSAQDDVSGLDSGLDGGMGCDEYVVEGGADGVRNVGGEIDPHPVQDAADRDSQTIHASKGDHYNDVINLVANLRKVEVPAKQVEGVSNVFADKVEPSM